MSIMKRSENSLNVKSGDQSRRSIFGYANQDTKLPSRDIFNKTQAKNHMSPVVSDENLIYKDEDSSDTFDKNHSKHNFNE